MRAIDLVGFLVPAILAPTSALACGGFFCDRGVPMDQSAERIVFSIDEASGTVETHVQISYEGEASRFAWVVPVPGVPDVGLSTDALFQGLAGITQPYWYANHEYRECNRGDTGWDADGGGNNGGSSNGGFPGGTGGDSGGPTGIDILASGQTGPYDWKVVSATSERALAAWLADPDGNPDTRDAYDMPEGSSALLASYLAGGSNFVAFKLLPDAGSGDIVPVLMRWPGDHATIPLILTALAATPDLRLEVYVLGAHRAVPLNYLHVTINEAAINWFDGGSNYKDLITRAADEAGGHAFATDAFVAVPDDPIVGSPTTDEMHALESVTDPIQFFGNLLSLGIPGNDVTLAIFREFLPEPASLVRQGIPDTQFYNCLSCWADEVASIDFDPVGFARALEEKVAAPMRAAAATVAKARYVTRLTSSVSPEEMTVDPRFGFNADMDAPLVEPYRVATLVIDCRGDVPIDRAPRTMVLPGGMSFRLPWGVDETGYGAWIASFGMRAASRIDRTGESGDPETIADYLAEIEEMLANGPPTDTDDPSSDTDVSGDTDTGDDDGGSCGCDQSAPGAGAGIALLLLAARRRRR